MALAGAAHAQTPPLPPPRPAAAPPLLPGPPVASPAAPTESAASCRAALARAGAVFVEAAPPTGDPLCAIADPVTLEAVAALDGRRIDLPERPTLACAAAEVFAAFVAEALTPLVRGSFDAALASVATGPGYECRRRNHAADGKLSAHARGQAVDIAILRFTDQSAYPVGRLTERRDRAFDHAARAAACGYFHTALGPGADAFHATHWHVDLESRGAGGQAKYCQ